MKKVVFSAAKVSELDHRDGQRNRVTVVANWVYLAYSSLNSKLVIYGVLRKGNRVF